MVFMYVVVVAAETISEVISSNGAELTALGSGYFRPDWRENGFFVFVFSFCVYFVSVFLSKKYWLLAGLYVNFQMSINDISY